MAKRSLGMSHLQRRVGRPFALDESADCVVGGRIWLGSVVAVTVVVVVVVPFHRRISRNCSGN